MQRRHTKHDIISYQPGVIDMEALIQASGFKVLAGALGSLFVL